MIPKVVLSSFSKELPPDPDSILGLSEPCSIIYILSDTFILSITTHFSLSVYKHSQIYFNIKTSLNLASPI